MKTYGVMLIFLSSKINGDFTMGSPTKVSSKYCSYKEKLLLKNNRTIKTQSDYRHEKKLFTKQIEYIKNNPRLHSGNIKRHCLSNIFLRCIPDTVCAVKFICDGVLKIPSQNSSVQRIGHFTGNSLCKSVSENGDANEVISNNSNNLHCYKGKSLYRRGGKKELIFLK